MRKLLFIILFLVANCSSSYQLRNTSRDIASNIVPFKCAKLLDSSTSINNSSEKINKKLSSARLIDELTSTGFVDFDYSVMRGRTIADLFQNAKRDNPNISLKEILLRENIPRSYHRFYNSNTGEFIYKRNHKIELALENGDAKIAQVRINFYDREISKELLFDFVEIMKEIDDMSLIVAVDKVNRKILNEQLISLNISMRNRIQVSEVEVKEYISERVKKDLIWAQDFSKPLSDGRQSLMSSGIESSPRIRLYRLFVESLEKNGLKKVIKSEFSFEGGNVVVGEKDIFVGPDIIHHLSETLKIDYHSAVKVISEEFGKPIKVVGIPYKNKNSNYLESTTFHIDLTMALVRDKVSSNGEEVVVLSSPISLLKNILGVQQIDDFSKSIYEISLNRFFRNLESTSTNSTDLELAKRLANISYETFVEEIAKEKYLKMYFNKLGYKTKEVPGLYPADEQTPLLNYVNVIVSDDTVIIPGYTSDFYNDIAASTYRSLGYKVIHAKSSELSLCDQGGIRCLSETYRHPIYQTIKN